VIMKSGRTISGARSAESHTGALATNDAIFSAACRQYGLFRSLTMESLLDAVKGLTMIKPPKGNRLMVISSSGGGNTLAVDAADDCNLEIPSVSDDFVEKVRKNLNLPFNATISNPCDLSFFEGSLFREIVNLADQYNLADTFLLNYGDPIPNGVQAARDLERAIDSSIVVAYFGGGEMEKQGQLQLHEYGIPVFPTPERAITGIHAAVDYATYRNSLQA
jgi:acyl-CoA synthetase (NDP forming)